MPAVSGATSFDDAMAVSAAGDGRFAADVAEGWDVRGNPHGGYLLALAATAIGKVVTQPDPISVSATYLAPPRFGPADVHVSVLRAGRRQSTAVARLVQDGVERLNTVATFGTLAQAAPEILATELHVPSMPRAEQCLPGDLLHDAEGEVIRLHERLELRLHPDTGWVHGWPSGTAELNGWLRHAGGRDPDLLAVLMFSDGMPPSLFEAVGRSALHTPTVQLTTHVFAHPAPGWVQGRFPTRVRAGSFLDEDGELWDSAGTLIATSRQLALVRTEGGRAHG